MATRHLTDINVSGDVTINGSHLKLLNHSGSYEGASTDYLYIGGSGLDGADAAIYLGNAGNNTGYGWRFYYAGSGSGNDNKLIIKSENAGSGVNALTFTQDGDCTFAGTISTTSHGSSTNWKQAYDNHITGIAVTGTSTKTITLTQRDGGTISANFSDQSGSGGITMSNGVNDRVVTATSSTNINGESGLLFGGSYLEITPGNIATPLQVKRTSASTRQVNLLLSANDGTTTSEGFLGIDSGADLRYGASSNTSTNSLILTEDNTDFVVNSSTNNAIIRLAAGGTNFANFNIGGLAGAITVNASSNSVTIGHHDTSSTSSVNNSGNTVIQDVTLDTYGHVTGLSSKTLTIPTVNNATLTVQGTGALGGSGTFTANQSSDATISISHDDTSSQSSINNSNGTVIQDVTLDGYGHVTGLGSVDLDNRYFRRYQGSVSSVSNSGYTTAFTVNGGNLASHISFSVQGTTSNVVVSNLIDLNVNHHQDIMLEALSGVYTQLSVKVISNNNEDFAVQLKTNHANAVTLYIEIVAYGGEVPTFTSSHSFTGATLEATLPAGKYIKGNGGDSGDLEIAGIFRGDGSGLTSISYNDLDDKPTIPTVNNGQLTVQGTGALGGSGTFTANQSGNTTISISHDDTSSQSSVNNSGNTFIQDITLDGYGHVTGISSGSASGFLTSESDTLATVTGRGASTSTTLSLAGGVNIVANPLRFQRSSSSQTGQDDNVSVTVDDSNIYFTHNNDADGDASGFNFRYSTGGSTANLLNFSASSLTYKGNTIWHSGNDGSGTGLDADTLDGNHASAFLTAHPNISAASSSNNSGNTFIQDITLDSNGHVTGIATATASGGGGDADTVDGFHADRFFRRIARANASVGPGWMTVAENTSGRRAGEIIVTDGDSGDHSYIRIEWVRSYTDSNWTVLNTGGHSNRITGVRVLKDGDSTYGNKKLQVYVTTSSNYEVNIYEQGDIDDYTGHTVVTPVIQNTISGYSTQGSSFQNLDDYPFSVDQGVQSSKLKGGVVEISGDDILFNNGYGNPKIDTYYGSLNISLGGSSAGVVYIGTGSGNTSGSLYATTQGGSSNSKVVYNSTYHSYYVGSSTEEMRLESDGDLHLERDVIAYSTTVSDIRLKDNVVTIDNALDKVCKLRGVEYTWNKGSRKDTKDLGVIAQEVEKVLPEIVKEKKMPLMDDSDTVYKTVDYEKLSAVLIEAVKEQQAQIDELTTILEEVTKQLNNGNNI